MEWTLLEIIIPKENIKSARAMEQVLTSLHATYSFGINRKTLYKKGKVEDWMSLEFVGFADGIYMYIRTPKAHTHLVQSAILAQYPEVPSSLQSYDQYTYSALLSLLIHLYFLVVEP